MDETKKNLNIERQNFQMKKKGFEDIAKALKEKPEVQKVELMGAEIITIKGKKGDKGDNGDKGDEGDKGDSIKGDKGDDSTVCGPKGDKGDKGDDSIVCGPQGDKGDKGDNGENGENGSPDTPQEIISKLQGVREEWLDINAIKGDFNSRVSIRGGKMASAATSLKQLTDVDYSGLTQDAQGNYILGSGAGSSAWGSITGTLADQIDLQAALNAKESALTFSTGFTRATNTITNNLSTGVSGGQSVIGGTASGNDLTLSSTSNATKGKILFGTSAYDEVNNRLGIGTANPLNKLDVLDTSTTNGTAVINAVTTASGVITKYGLWAQASGATTTNVAGYFTATGATNNYGLVVAAGKVGIGTTTPPALLSITGGDIFLRADRFIGAGNNDAAYNSVWNRIRLYNGGSGDMEFTLHSSSWYARFSANLTVVGNVGIGTASPTTARLVLADTTLAGSGSLAGGILDMTQTWNTTGTPTALRLNVTDTASNASSLLMDLRVGGSSKIKVDKSGVVTTTAPVILKGYTVATLPAPVVGMTAYITDATTPTYNGALVGGGAITVPVFYNGIAWVSA